MGTTRKLVRVLDRSGEPACLPAPDLCGYFFGRGRLSDYGIRFVWYSGLLGTKARPMYGTAHPEGFTRRSTNYHKVDCKDKELSA